MYAEFKTNFELRRVVPHNNFILRSRMRYGVRNGLPLICQSQAFEYKRISLAHALASENWHGLCYG
jgi:hypothetical protein